MCFERFITEVHTIKVHLVTTTDHWALGNDHSSVGRNEGGYEKSILIYYQFKCN